MSSLEKTLAALLETKAEAEDILRSSAAEAESLLLGVKKNFERLRADRTEQTKQKAEEIVRTAQISASEEAARYAELCAEQRRDFTARFEKELESLLDSLTENFASEYVKRSAE
ncbi:MAG: hypothetical protein Q4E34_05865 [Synergistaceae bacterium]|nr:hypothetical protein [Synergistaceae bacterium]